MSLATAALVRESFGWDQTDSYLLFRMADDAALTAFLNRKIVIASAWIEARADGDYPPAAPNKLAAFTEAEIYLTAAYAVERLKTLKATGTNFPYLQEDSPALHDLIENNYHERVRELLLDYIVVDAPGSSFVLPTFGVGAAVDTSTSSSWPTYLQNILDETQGLVGRS